MRHQRRTMALMAPRTRDESNFPNFSGTRWHPAERNLAVLVATRGIAVRREPIELPELTGR